MTRLKKLIKEALSTPPKKKDCNCGCGGCSKKAISLNESIESIILSEGLQYHINNKTPLTEQLYRAGSKKYFELWAEARSLYSRNLLNVKGDDEEILNETHLGHFEIYEGKKVPLDFPMVNEEKEYYVTYNKGRGQGKGLVKSKKSNYEEPRVFSKEEAEEYAKEAESRSRQMTAYWVSDKDMNRLNEGFYSSPSDLDETGLNVRPKNQIHANMLKDALENSGLYAEWNAREGYFFFPEEQDLYDQLEEEIQMLMDENNIQGYIEGVVNESLNEAKTLRNNDKYLGYSASEQIYYVKDSKTGKEVKHTENAMAQLYGSDWKEQIDEAKKKKKKKKNPPLNKPKRGGSKAYYVYVRDPKTKKIKKVSFGSGGLKAKINNPKARQAFAKRHKCSTKKDKTKAGYWSCRLPRYAKQLGLKSNFTGFW